MMNQNRCRREFRLLTVLPLLVVGVGTASAGHGMGNGGSAVVCYSTSEPRQMISVELFDYWEAERTAPVPDGIDLGGPELTVRQKLEYAINRLSRMDRDRAELYRKKAYFLLEHMDEYLVDSLDLIDDDDHERAVPEAPCVKVQFAIQTSAPTAGKRRFQVRRDLYLSPVTTNDARAGIILHEAVYQEALGLGHTDSDRVRTYNYVIATRSAEDYSLYAPLHRSMGFTSKFLCRPVFVRALRRTLYVYATPFGEYGVPKDGRSWAPIFCRDDSWTHQGIEVQAIAQKSSVSFRAFDEVKSLNGVDWKTRIGSTALRNSIHPDPAKAYPEGYIALHPDGKLAGMVGAVLESGPDLRISIENRSIACGFWPASIRGDNDTLGVDVKFFPDGRIEKCVLKGPHEVEIPNGLKVKLYGARVDARGHLDVGYLAESVPLPVSGTSRSVEFTKFVEFDPQYQVKRGRLAKPITYNFKGYPLNLSDITAIGGGIVQSDTVTPVEMKYDGRHRFLYPETWGETRASERINVLLGDYCITEGFDRQVSYASVGNLWLNDDVVYVGPLTSFYDLELDRVVTRVDENVKRLLGHKYCIKTVSLAW